MIHIVGPHDKKRFLQDPDAFLIDVTSQSSGWTKCFSPFFLGPVKLYGNERAENVENAWQYAKVYEDHADERGVPTPDYWRWARAGWAKKRAERYPRGKGAVPMYSLWEGDRLGYVDAKRRVYVPLYEGAVRASGRLPQLVDYVRHLQSEGRKVGFFDFDGFDLQAAGMSFDDVLNSKVRKLGHAIVLARMVEEHGRYA